MYGIYANIGGILMVNVTIYSIHGSYGVGFESPNLLDVGPSIFIMEIHHWECQEKEKDDQQKHDMNKAQGSNMASSEIPENGHVDWKLIYKWQIFHCHDCFQLSQRGRDPMRSYWRVSIGHFGDPLQGWKQGTKDEGHWNPAIVDWGDSYAVSFHKNYIKFPMFFLFVLLDLLFLLGKDHFYPTNGWTNLSDQTPRLAGDVCYWCHAGFQASARGEETHFITVSARALMTSYDNREQPNRMQKSILVSFHHYQPFCNTPIFHSSLTNSLCLIV
jgi:hypothetical protein